MSCEERTGQLCWPYSPLPGRGGRILELGTGVGEGTAWLLSGMDQASRLVTVELGCHGPGGRPRAVGVRREGDLRDRRRRCMAGRL
ncbi:hypothetical protein ACRAWF_35200 [Streptomyces sp. L7]